MIGSGGRGARRGLAVAAVVGLFVIGTSASSEAAPPVRVAEPVAFADGFRVEA